MVFIPGQDESSPSVKPKRQPRSRGAIKTQDVIAAYCRHYTATHDGKRPVITGVDAGQAKLLAAFYNENPDEDIDQHLDLYFSIRDSYLIANSHALRLVRSRLNRIRDMTINKSDKFTPDAGAKELE